ncbi:hypothetical protein [Candidatus Thiodictyon syntrophicum]|jgi:type I restriction enzyme M protein|uniref:Uncharacterized protein n=1 Tax=Candidatus Thiodictyon syntrophicum TaxID=1166950 RepID=A0A2K8UEJ9_9GAMM|nr:hypothetical protein [Candidatus Thiodictyon syntrophicum]AUB83994.1 hypothetical protein THSYN_25705 [Candidatus Thiodictyon syntrophicum]
MRLASAVEIARHYRAVFNRVRVEYPEFFDSEDELLLGPEALAWTMRQLSHLLVEQSDGDVIGDAYEVFMGSALRGQEGQFVFDNG